MAHLEQMFIFLVKIVFSVGWAFLFSKLLEATHSWRRERFQVRDNSVTTTQNEPQSISESDNDNDLDIDNIKEDDLIAESEKMPELAENGLNSISNCLRSDNYKNIGNESKKILKNCVKWQQTLYKTIKNAVKDVQIIEKNLETESKVQASKHETFLNVNEAKELTNNILNNVTGSLNDKNTLFQLISQISPNSLFYDPKVKTTSYSPNDENNQSIVLKLSNVPALANLNIQNVNESKKVQTQLISEMKYAIENSEKFGNNQTHPILKQTRESLADAYGVSANDIEITNVYYGSFCFEYNIRDSKKHVDQLLGNNITEKLKAKFKYFEDNKIHPSMFDAFNVNDFDARGNKSFSGSQTFEVGPPGRTQTYTQPNGWTRFGLNVLNGKYGNDNTWLDPFQHANNWYRAFHGVACVRGDDMSIPKIIHQNGFLPGGGQAHSSCIDIQGRKVGNGVYCSPNISLAESYGGRLTLKLTNGTSKNFKMMFQVCVEPNQIRICSQHRDYWIAPNAIGMIGSNNHVEDNIRAYGILLKEV